MSRGPVIYESTITIPVTDEQKEVIRRGAIATGESMGMFARRVSIKEALKEVRRLKKAA